MNSPRYIVPADVPKDRVDQFLHHFNLLARGTDSLFIFAADHKIEHLNADFYGPGIPAEVNDPEHLFQIAARSPIGAFATQLGLISRYASMYSEVVYVAKLNSKTNLLRSGSSDPKSALLWTVDDVIRVKNSKGIRIAAVGITIYLGSMYEDKMLADAARQISRAHQEGLVAILWIYPRGSGITHEDSLELTAGAAGVANALGADVVKLKVPHDAVGDTSQSMLELIARAAGNTKIIYSGGKRQEVERYLMQLGQQLSAGSSGCAIGRTIFQRTRAEAYALSCAISLMIHEQKNALEAFETYTKMISE